MSDTAYRERAKLVAFLSHLYSSYLSPPNDAEPEFPLAVFISTPAGQLSWHLSKEDIELFQHLPIAAEAGWDGHTTEEKYKRLEILGQVTDACRGHESCIEEGIRWERDHPDGITHHEQQSMDRYDAERQKEPS